MTIFVVFASCKKAGEKSCFKSYGEITEKEILLDSVIQFRLFKDITYHLYQDSLKKIVIRGGSNVIEHIHVSNQLNVLTVMNMNECNFLRDYDKKIEVDIHYPDYGRIYTEINDSLIFEDTIASEYLHVEQVYGGGGTRLCVNVNRLVLIARQGVGHYKLSGRANEADLRVETNASGDATDFKAKKYLLYQNSTADMDVNLDSAEVHLTIKGTGNILYAGTPDSLVMVITGDGQLLKK